MRGKNAILRVRLYLLGIFILFAGLAAAIFVYRVAADGRSEAVGYEMAGDGYYAISPRDSKAYLHDLELYGGKAAVMADAFNRWFESLWHGKSLAYTLASLAVGLALMCFFAASRLPRDSSPDHPMAGPEA